MNAEAASIKPSLQRRSSYGSVQPEEWAQLKEKEQLDVDSLLFQVVVDVNRAKRRIWFNVILANAGIFFSTLAMTTIVLLQSSINEDQGLGVTSLSVKYATMIIGSIVAPYLFLKLGCKTGLTIGSLLYIAYVPANFYPSWYTLIPTAILAGFGATMKDIFHKVYLARLANALAEYTQQSIDRVNSRLFVLYVIASMSSVSAGNVISSLILKTPIDDESLSRASMCGVQYCNEPLDSVQIYLNGSYDLAEEQELMNEFTVRKYFLIGICTMSGILSVLLFASLDSLKKLDISSNMDLVTSPKGELRNVLLSFKDVRLLLLIPMVVVLQDGDTFFAADFTKAFITCSIGVGLIGYVFMFTGVVACIACILLGWFNNKTMRCFPVVSATVLQICAIMALFYWVPSTTSQMSNYWSLTAFLIIQNFGQCTRHFITPVLVSVLFRDNLETSYSFYHLWIYITATVTYAWSNVLCVDSKLYILLAFIAISFIAYVVIELVEHFNNSERIDYNIILSENENSSVKLVLNNKQTN